MTLGRNTMAKLAVSTALNDMIIVETSRNKYCVFCVTKALLSMISVHEKKKNQLKE